MAYTLVNSGHTIRPQMENTMKGLAEKLADAGQSSDVVWLQAAGWVLKNALGWIFADCDGPVLAGVQRFNGNDLEQKLSSGQKIAGNDRQLTSDVSGSWPWQCGAPSDYDPFFEVKQEPSNRARL